MYQASVKYLDRAFLKAWEHVVSCLPQNSDGSTVVRYFKNHYNIDLIYGISGHKYGAGDFGWQYVQFESESAYVMFMLEWS